ncbi:hypothetical protein ACQBAR_09885 [Propionibacteriaceae bacterium Y1685]
MINSLPQSMIERFPVAEPVSRDHAQAVREQLAREGTVTLRGNILLGVVMVVGALLLCTGAVAGVVAGVQALRTELAAGPLAGTIVMGLAALLFGFGILYWGGRLLTARRAIVADSRGLGIDGSDPVPWQGIHGFRRLSFRGQSAVVVEMSARVYAQVRPTLGIPLRWIPPRSSAVAYTVQLPRVRGLSNGELKRLVEAAWLRFR